MAEGLNYQGQAPPKPGRAPYLPSPELIEAVNLAIFLRRPLLLRGEPGCGKTRLAQAVADELGLEDGYIAWHIKSTSRARDGLYTYDSVGRLREAQLVVARSRAGKAPPPESEAGRYVRWGELGRAFRSSQPAVLLIDEIDKADIDFPNDLLRELDEGWFLVEETGERVEAKNRPLVYITSNEEKELPDAFLRRCLVHVIEFPDKKQLIRIINAHLDELPKTLVAKAVDRFLALRRQMEAEKGDAGKKVSTSELIDWCRVLGQYGRRDKVLAQLDRKLPYPSVLLKSWEDHRRFLRTTTPEVS